LRRPVGAAQHQHPRPRSACSHPAATVLVCCQVRIAAAAVLIRPPLPGCRALPRQPGRRPR
jgi:hypothetical protein